MSEKVEFSCRGCGSRFRGPADRKSTVCPKCGDKLKQATTSGPPIDGEETIGVSAPVSRPQIKPVKVAKPKNSTERSINDEIDFTSSFQAATAVAVAVILVTIVTVFHDQFELTARGKTSVFVGFWPHFISYSAAP